MRTIARRLLGRHQADVPKPGWAQQRANAAADALSAEPPDYKAYHAHNAAAHDLAGKSVLVIGCAQGSDCKLFVDLGAASVTGLDVSDDIGVDYSHPLVSYVTASAEAIPLPDASFDLVFSYATFEHVPDIASAYIEAARLVAPGGRIYIIAAPLWHARSGPHWGSAYDSEPWPHLRLSTDKLLALAESLRINNPNHFYYSEVQVQYCMDPRFFNRRRAAEYVQACALLPDIHILTNELMMETLPDCDKAILRDLFDKGYTYWDLFGHAHLLVAERR